MGFTQHTLLIHSHIIPSQLASENPEHYCLARATLGLLQGTLKHTLTRLCISIWVLSGTLEVH